MKFFWKTFIHFFSNISSYFFVVSFYGRSSRCCFTSLKYSNHKRTFLKKPNIGFGLNFLLCCDPIEKLKTHNIWSYSLRDIHEQRTYSILRSEMPPYFRTSPIQVFETDLSPQQFAIVNKTSIWIRPDYWMISDLDIFAIEEFRSRVNYQ